MPRIIPIRELKNTNAISEMCREADEPIFVTKNGYGEMVVMSMEIYERLFKKLESYRDLAVCGNKGTETNTKNERITANDLTKKGDIKIQTIKEVIFDIAEEYGLTKVTLFGSRATGTNKADSDIDLIIEFNRPVSLMYLAKLKEKLEELTKLNVDIVHGPVQETDMIEIGEVIELYAA